MSAFPEITPDDDVLVKLDRAHRAYEESLRLYSADVEKANKELAAKHNPFLWAAQSVLYEAMGNAALAGFEPKDLARTMGCANH